MSDELELNDQLVASVKAALKAHDQRADDDTLMIQYLAALIGYLMAGQNMDSEKRYAALQQLSNFSGHVMQQMELRAGKFKPSDDAFGIWKPKADKDKP